jgi:hypothetical protein
MGMSVLSFITFSVEMYAEHAGMGSPDVYRLFESSGLLDMLRSDYENLRGMSWEYLVREYDEYLKGGLV